MITKMKKLTFLVYHKEYEAFLAQIRELGVVHVVERQCGEMDDTLQQFMQKRTLYKNMLQSMHKMCIRDRRMPWLSEAMKDVISCDKLRGGANNL